MDYPFALVKAFHSQRGDDRTLTATGNWLTEPLDWIDNLNSWEMVLNEEQVKYQREREEQAEANKLLSL
jgi:hypothetical protein